MNRVNPIHVGVLLVALLAFFGLQLSIAKEDLKNEQFLYQETLGLATQLQGLTVAYGDKNAVKKSIETLLNNSSLKSANIERKTTASGIVLASNGLDKTALNFLMSKVLNGSYNVASLEIKRIDDKRASLKMEIKW